jgi:hypothetical protein
MGKTKRGVVSSSKFQVSSLKRHASRFESEAHPEEKPLNLPLLSGECDGYVQEI